MPTLDAPKLAHVCDLSVKLAPVMDLGPGRGAQRRIVQILGGEVTGPRIKGRVLNLGADWQSVYADGLAALDTRYAIETHDGALIEVQNFGLRHGPAEVMEAMMRGEAVSNDAYYMRTQAKLETGHKDYLWVNRTLFVGTGAREAERVHISLFALE